MQQKNSDLLKYVEKVMNEDCLFNDLKMVLSAGYIAAYMSLQKGERGKAQKVASLLKDLGRDCSPFIKRTMDLIQKCYMGEIKQ